MAGANLAMVSASERNFTSDSFVLAGIRFMPLSNTVASSTVTLGGSFAGDKELIGTIAASSLCAVVKPQCGQVDALEDIFAWHSAED